MSDPIKTIRELTLHGASIGRNYDVIGLALHGLEIIESIVGSMGPTKAAFHAIEAALEVIRSGLEGDVSPGDANAKLSEFVAMVADNDARADKAIAAKFGAPRDPDAHG